MSQGVGQLGRSPHSGCGERRFKSARPDQLSEEVEALVHRIMLRIDKGDFPCGLDIRYEFKVSQVLLKCAFAAIKARAWTGYNYDYHGLRLTVAGWLAVRAYG